MFHETISINHEGHIKTIHLPTQIPYTFFPVEIEASKQEIKTVNVLEYNFDSEYITSDVLWL